MEVWDFQLVFDYSATYTRKQLESWEKPEGIWDWAVTWQISEAYTQMHHPNVGLGLIEQGE